MKMWREAAGMAEFDQADRKLVEVNGKAVLLLKSEGSFFAIGAVCSHGQASMILGKVSGFELVCPLHGARFDLRTGKPLSPPATRPLVRHELKVENGKILVLV